MPQKTYMQELNRRSAAVRGERRALRQKAQAGAVRVADIIEDPPACLAGLTIGELVAWAPMVRKSRARTLLRGIVPSVEVRALDLGDEQRRRLVARLRERDARLERQAA